ncbi:MAG: NUDIX hydrolase [Candidatus Eremiobacteraeota bacterium]|nr:NUDIX hydrolase [Candidatus Eremiobacteraeota bacterium]
MRRRSFAAAKRIANVAEKPPQVISSRPVFQGRVFNVRTDVIAPNGKPYAVDVVEHPHSYAIIARPSPREVILVRQYRHAAGAYLWELPAGSAEPDEDAIAGVRRELREETGYSARSVREVLSTYMTPGFCTELMRYFVCEGLTSGQTDFDEDEDIETATFTIERAIEMIEKREIVDAKSIVGLLFLDRFLDT